VALFYGLALGWACLVVAGLYVLGQRDLSSAGASQIGQVVLALLYMPAPAAAAVVMRRLDHRRLNIRGAFTGVGRKLARVVPLVVGFVVLAMFGMIAASWLAGNALAISGAGKLVFSADDVIANILVNQPSMDAAAVARLAAATPPMWGLAGLTAAEAVVAALTVNALFAFGEEFGWRGWLADELRPLGAVWANVLTGILWGLWHAPIILLGFNYGGSRLGVAFMVVLCIPLAFLLWRAREVTGTLYAPAALHGALNAFAGFFILVLVDPNPLLAAPVGLIGAAVIGIVAALLWLLPLKPARDPEPEKG
jgi:membrane protease YdiL (CAAX protease family)